MIKMIGLIMIVGSCSAMGISMNRRLTGRARALTSFIAAFQIIKAEIVFRASPLCEIYNMIREQCTGAAADYFGAAASSLAKGGTLKQTNRLKAYGLTDADIRHIKSVLHALGRYDAVTQAEAISHAQRGLEIELCGARDDLAQKGKLYRAMGVTVGIMIALIVV